jgi:short-subunit dehydrogenase
MDWKENVVVITGASIGIGREMALQLAAQGAWLALAARREDKLAEVAEACRARGAKAPAISTDVSERIQCQRLIEQTIKAFGRIDTLVNNAGITMRTYFEEIQDPGILENIMKVNFFGGVYCTYYALPHLKQSRGRIVSVSSLTGKTGMPMVSGYAASKHAIVGFFDSLRIELRGSGVSVTIVYPDFVATKIRERAIGADGKPLGALGKEMAQDDKIMAVNTCAERIIDAIARRKRELVMTFRGRMGLWLKLIVPQMVDRIAYNAITRGKQEKGGRLLLIRAARCR